MAPATCRPAQESAVAVEKSIHACAGRPASPGCTLLVLAALRAIRCHPWRGERERERDPWPM